MLHVVTRAVHIVADLRLAAADYPESVLCASISEEAPRPGFTD